MFTKDNGVKQSPHLEKQYEFFTRHLEYHDSTIFKVLSIFFIFVGVFLAKVDNFKCTQAEATLIVVIVGAVFFAILYRTSRLLDEFKKRINELDKEIDPELKKTTISDFYLGEKNQWLRTSKTGMLSIIILSLILIINLQSNETLDSCNSPNVIVQPGQISK